MVRQGAFWEVLEPRLLLTAEGLVEAPFVVTAASGTVLPNGWIYAGRGPAPSLLQINQTANRNAADTTNADQLWSGGGLGLALNGADYTVGIWDGGYVRTTHRELTGRVTIKDTGGSLQDHATHVGGTIGATGVTASARGMANAVNLWSYEWTNDISEMAAAAPYIIASNQSYGFTRGWTYTNTTGPQGKRNYGMWYGDRYESAEDAGFGKYDSDTQSLDAMLYSNPYLLSVWAASNDRGETYASLANYYLTYLGGTYGGWYWVPVNDATYPAPGPDGASTGYDTLPEMQTAKNTLVVGAINDITADPYGASDVVMTSYSSWGPTDDGRIKPDVVGNGDALYSTFSGNNNAYGTMSGTSMATPNVTGSSVLLIEYYKDLFGSMPLAATTKAAIIQNAFDAGRTGPDYTYGWGVLDAAATANFYTSVASGGGNSYLWQNSYAGSDWTYSFCSDGASPLKATMAWTDPAPTVLPGAGVDDGTSVLAHDLDLWIVGPGGTIYYPWTLDPAHPGNAALQTAANHLDNVEQVLLSAPTPGLYTLHVGRTGAAFTQDYSLALSGATPNAPPTVAGVLINNGQTQRSVIRQAAVQFSEDVSASLTASDLSIFDAVTGLPVDTSQDAVSYDSGSNTATWDLSAVILPDGWYKLVLASSGVTDALGASLDGDGDGVMGGDWSYTLHRLYGDIDGGASVDVGDLGILATHYGETGDWWTLNADLNADGGVDVGDLGILATGYGQSLSPLGSPGGGVAAATQTTPFVQSVQTAEIAGVVQTDAVEVLIPAPAPMEDIAAFRQVAPANVRAGEAEGLLPAAILPTPPAVEVEAALFVTAIEEDAALDTGGDRGLVTLLTTSLPLPLKQEELLRL